MEWINVNDRVPDTNREVLVCHWYYDGCMDLAIAYFNGNKWRADEGLLEATNYDGGCTISLSDDPTHWAEIPVAPVEVI